MKKILKILSIAGISILFCPDLQALEREVPASSEQVALSYAPIVKKSAPAVVNIYSARKILVQSSPFAEDPFFKQFFGDNPAFGGGRLKQKVVSSLGSGVVVDGSGIIITNNHVIKGAQEIKVVLSDRREFEAKPVLIDLRADIALLKVDAGGEKLPYLEFGDMDSVEVGDVVLAIGNPFGVGQTVTSGIVSALARTTVGIIDYESFIQTDAAINPGNSGGALVNMEGKLVGINTAIFSKSGGSLGIGFATPAAMAKVVVNSYLNGSNKVVRPWLGATTQNITAEIANSLGIKVPKGAIIKSIYSGSPAEKSGLKVGDVILGIDGHELDDVQSLKFRIATSEVGKSAEFDILRGGVKDRVKVTMELPQDYPPRNPTTITGNNPLGDAVVENISPALAEEIGIEETSGVIISGFKGNAIAKRFFAIGDIVVSVNNLEAKDTNSLQTLMDNFARGWKITIKRGGQPLTVNVKQ